MSSTAPGYSLAATTRVVTAASLALGVLVMLAVEVGMPDVFRRGLNGVRAAPTVDAHS